MMIWVVIIFFLFIGFWEALALLDKQRRIPSWSRLIRMIWQNDRPEMRVVIFIVTLTLGCIVTVWMAIHFVVPEGF